LLLVLRNAEQSLGGWCEVANGSYRGPHWSVEDDPEAHGWCSES
jgi:hypothetical protein